MKKTIYDLAKELKLAPSTVSKALSGKKGVNDATRKRVIDYAEKVRYFPSQLASQLKTKKTYSIGVLFADDLDIGLEHTFFSSILQSFKTYVERKGYEITFIISKVGKRELSYLEFCQLKGIEGVLLLTSLESDPLILELVNSPIHSVSTDGYFENAISIHSDNLAGSRLAVKHFRNKGHQSIGIITGPLNNFSARERFEGYKTSLEEFGIEYNQEFVISAEHYSFQHGYWCGRIFLERKIRPKAVLVAADTIAMGFIRCLQEHGVKVPEDIEVIAFDDIPFSKLFSPALSTIRQETQTIGQVAAIRLIDLIESKSNEKLQNEWLPVSLILRESTK